MLLPFHSINELLLAIYGASIKYGTDTYSQILYWSGYKLSTMYGNGVRQNFGFLEHPSAVIALLEIEFQLCRNMCNYLNTYVRWSAFRWRASHMRFKGC